MKRLSFSSSSSISLLVARLGPFLLTISAPALEPEVLYNFQLGPANPKAGLVQGSDGNFYGTTYTGGTSDLGTVFRVTTNGVVTTLASFHGTNGALPEAELVLSSDGNFCGTTSAGGTGFTNGVNLGYGTVFKVTLNGLLTTVVSFNGTNGAYPRAGLVPGSDGNLYGTTSGALISGPSYYGSYGTVFQLSAAGVLTTLASFTGTNGAYPLAGLAFSPDGNLYGTTSSSYDSSGTVFKVTTNGVLSTLGFFDYINTGGNPHCRLLLGADGAFYGTTQAGGGTDNGTVFRVTTNGQITVLVSFEGQTSPVYDAWLRLGASPQAGLVRGPDGSFYGTTYAGGTGYGTVFRVTPDGVLTYLAGFSSTNGQYPLAGLSLGRDGDLYGTTSAGGNDGLGTVFRTTTNGLLTALASFSNPDGAHPMSSLTLGHDGQLYGTTYGGNTSGYGTIFRISSNGVLTTLASFGKVNGTNPKGRLLPGSEGSFYGTTYNGGSNGMGSVFKFSSDEQLISLASFTRTNGQHPAGGLVWGSDGLLYGTTFGFRTQGRGGLGLPGTVFKVTTNGMLTHLGSVSGLGHPVGELVLGPDRNFYGTAVEDTLSPATLFKVTRDGVLTNLLTFNGTIGGPPEAGLLLAPDGNFYGTTYYAGSNFYGSVFRFTTSGLLTPLASFTGANGAYSKAPLLVGSDGNLYGTTFRGGTSSAGTVFQVTAGGTLRTVLSFNYTNGANPEAGLVLAPDGHLYGTTSSGGTGGGGTIFRIPIPPTLTRIIRLPSGNTLLTGTGPANQRYRLWATTNISAPFNSWTLLTNDVFDAAGNSSFTDTGVAASGSRFYRISSP